MIDQLRNAAHPAGSQIRRDKEDPQTHSLYHGRQRDDEIVFYIQPVFFHGKSLYQSQSKTKHE